MEKLAINETDTKSKILDYFLLAGIDNKSIDYLKTYEEIINTQPKILASYNSTLNQDTIEYNDVINFANNL